MCYLRNKISEPLSCSFLTSQLKSFICCWMQCSAPHCLYSASYFYFAAVWLLEECFEEGGMLSCAKQTDGKTTWPTSSSGPLWIEKKDNYGEESENRAVWWGYCVDEYKVHKTRLFLFDLPHFFFLNCSLVLTSFTCFLYVQYDCSQLSFPAFFGQWFVS